MKAFDPGPPPFELLMILLCKSASSFFFFFPVPELVSVTCNQELPGQSRAWSAANHGLYLMFGIGAGSREQSGFPLSYVGSW